MATGRFFCHSCSLEISPTQDFKCPRCSDDFIEEILQQPAAEQYDVSPVASLPIPGLMDVHTGGASNAMGLDVVSLEMLLSNLMGILGRFPQQNMFNLYGNPGDYAWGPRGLDTIITQLLNQMEGKVGSPPAQTEQITALPYITISQENIERGLQCSVCMEDFILAETVRQLPCAHFYHTDCIVPWLQLHGTCPVCRKTLEGKDTTKDEFIPSNFEPVAAGAGSNIRRTRPSEAGPSEPRSRSGNEQPYEDDLYEFD